MEKLVLQNLLSNKPKDTKEQLDKAYTDLSCNFEFAVSVDMAKTKQHMDEGNQKGFLVWCNQDAKSAIIYGAGMVYQETFTDYMTWLNNIRLKTDVAIAHFMAADGEKLVEIK